MIPAGLRDHRLIAPLRTPFGRKLGLAGLGALAILGAGMGTAAHLSAQPAPQRAMADGSRAVLTGTVAEVFGHHFVLQNTAGRVLVDLGREGTAVGLRPGEPVTVTGTQGSGPFRAEALRRGDGPELALRRPGGPQDGPGRQAGGPRDDRGGPREDRGGPREERGGPREERGGPGRQGGPREEAARISPDEAVRAVRAAGYAVTGEAIRGPRHFEVPATNARGEAVRLHVDLDGRPYKETWVRPEGAGRPTGAPSEAEARRMAVAAGFTPIGDFVRKDRHAELDATGRDGRRVELRLDTTGIREVNFGR